MSSDEQTPNPEKDEKIVKITDYGNMEEMFSIKTPDHIMGTSDDSLAVLFADKFHKNVRYVGQWGKWMVWEGTKWEIDHMLRAYEQTREFMRTVVEGLQNKIYKSNLKDLISPKCTTTERARGRMEALRDSRAKVKPLLSFRTINSVSAMARADRRIATSVDTWDSNPYLLNTPDGTIDLRTGHMLNHDPLDYITRTTMIAPLSRKPRRWLDFLKTIMHGDEEMVRYLQKIFGYCLVGETKEHQMYFAYGTGANGKGVTLNTMRNLLGDYGVEANIETFIITGYERHPTELADLRGARLVTCGETDEGQRWAEARIKTLTGGDPVKARFMRQDFFQYQPQFKLFLAGNHKPRLSNVDEALQRRFRLIPFTYTVPRDERDLDLAEKMKVDWPGILDWAIEGCIMWQAEGLEPPAVVAEATKSYLSQEDAITSWYGDCCVPDDKAFTYIKDLFASWAKWAQDSGEHPGTKRVLMGHLEERGPLLKILKGRRSEGLGFHGIALVGPAELK
jgi:putative DNA primase/helicase